MPAYRSSAEADIREPVVAKLRALIPGCRIIHEINAASYGNRIDVLAVGDDTLAAVEIKSAKDKIDRLPAQIAAMANVSNLVFAALHEKFLYTMHGGFYPPSEANGAIVWAWPVADRKGHVHCGTDWQDRDRWKKPLQCLPIGALSMLWREEVQQVCRGFGIKAAGQLTMEQARDHIMWRMTGAEITRMICAMLRQRECVEGDQPVARAA